MRIITAENSLQEVPINSYDAVIIQNKTKQAFNLARFALVNKKHVMLVAPLYELSLEQLEDLERTALANKAVFYIAYGNRFIPQLTELHTKINNGEFGKIQHCRLLYTATMRENHNGALLELGSHVLNSLQYLFGVQIMQRNFNIVYKGKFDRQVIFADFNTNFSIEVEANLLSATDKICCEIYGTTSSMRSEILCDASVRDNLLRLEQNDFPSVCKTWLDAKADKWLYTELEHLQKADVLLA